MLDATKFPLSTHEKRGSKISSSKCLVGGRSRNSKSGAWSIFSSTSIPCLNLEGGVIRVNQIIVTLVGLGGDKENIRSLLENQVLCSKPKHVLGVCQLKVEEHNTPWPACSPNLSPVEHVWDQIKQQMPSCHSVHDLELAVQDLWAHLPQVK
ncbi:transposable element Tcb2 transposase [Trichonephila clavipes]|nr:transposable element Tcb2 transposase [Trichonephila clavipes]